MDRRGRCRTIHSLPDPVRLKATPPPRRPWDRPPERTLRRATPRRVHPAPIPNPPPRVSRGTRGEFRARPPHRRSTAARAPSRPRSPRPPRARARSSAARTSDTSRAIRCRDPSSGTSAARRSSHSIACDSLHRTCPAATPRAWCPPPARRRHPARAASRTSPTPPRTPPRASDALPRKTSLLPEHLHRRAPPSAALLRATARRTG